MLLGIKCSWLFNSFLFNLLFSNSLFIETSLKNRLIVFKNTSMLHNRCVIFLYVCIICSQLCSKAQNMICYCAIIFWATLLISFCYTATIFLVIVIYFVIKLSKSRTFLCIVLYMLPVLYFWQTIPMAFVFTNVYTLLPRNNTYKIKCIESDTSTL